MCWAVDRVIYDEHEFFISVKRRSDDGLWNIWVSLLEEESCKTTDYTCSIHFVSRSENCNSRKIFYELNPVSLDFSEEMVFLNGLGVVFTDAIAKKFIIESRLEWEVKLSKNTVY